LPHNNDQEERLAQKAAIEDMATIAGMLLGEAG
jgi:hypothetical protein